MAWQERYLSCAEGGHGGARYGEGVTMEGGKERGYGGRGMEGGVWRGLQEFTGAGEMWGPCRGGGPMGAQRPPRGGDACAGRAATRGLALSVLLREI